jgi:phosphatidylserine decarboxylase
MTFKEPIHYSFYAPELYIGLIIIIYLALKYKNKYIYTLLFFLISLIIFFYRRNTNPINMEMNTIVSPCEGKILKILKQNEHLVISVFLNVNNVHIQYFPCDGLIINKEYKKGEFNPAYLFEKSKYNEQLQTTLSTKYGKLKLNQIAGLVARRIVSFNNINDKVKKGQPLGLIKFGSRVDTYIPIRFINEITVKEGDSIKIGDVICKMML